MQVRNRVEGYQAIKPGRYHFKVASIEDTTLQSKKRSGNPCTKLHLFILAGTDPQMAGKMHIESIEHYPDHETALRIAQEQIILLACVLGVGIKNTDKIATIDNVNELVEANIDIEFKWEEAAGKHFCGEIEAGYDKETKANTNLDFVKLKAKRIYAIDDPRAADIPKDVEAIELIQWPAKALDANLSPDL